MTPLRENIVPASLITLSSIGITFALFSMKAVLVPFVFSILLYFVISPLMNWFKVKCHLPRIISLFITFSLVILFFTGFVLLLGISIKSFIQSGKLYYNNLLLLVEQISSADFLTRFDIEIDLSVIEQFLTSLPILDWISYLSGSVVGIISNIFLVLIFLLFIVVGEKSETARQIIDDEVESKITRYIATKFFTSLLTGTITFIILISFQVDLALMFSIITFFLNFIPNIGSIIATAIIIPIIFLQYGIGVKLILIISTLTVTQFVIGNIVDPKLMGENLGLHPVFILLSLLFWGYIWGIAGMFLAVPLSAVLKILVNRSKITEFFLQTLEKDI